MKITLHDNPVRARQHRRNQPSESEVESLLDQRHTNPHAILGAHATLGGVVVRTLRPNAVRLTLRTDDGSSWPMRRTHDRGLFQADLPDEPPGFGYRFETEDAIGNLALHRDPYCFPPSLDALDLHLSGQPRPEVLYQSLGAHPRVLAGVDGVAFAVWAPNALGVSVIGDFNGWDGRVHMMRRLDGCGIWELFVPDAKVSDRYRYEIQTAAGPLLKHDPFAFQMELSPKSASVVTRTAYEWGDSEWITRRARENGWGRTIAIYELHLGSWRRDPERPDRPLTYRELAPLVADYVLDLGFTHVGLVSIQEHRWAGSRGAQVSGYFAPTSRHGGLDDFKWFVDYLHRRGIGVIVDWAPAQFPKSKSALARFDGSTLYERQAPSQQGDDGYTFDFARAEVRNFLLASASYWLEELHADGLRVGAVDSMLYLDHGRSDQEWVPNALGGREDLEAVAFLKDLNQTVHRRCPGALMIAEASPAWPGVSRNVELGGLGFGCKWNLGWLRDTLHYLGKDPIYRRYHHHQLTAGAHYAASENFVLPLSHDEMARGTGSLLDKMPGDRWQKLANLRALLAHTWAYPGKKLLFMGAELAQWREWNHEQSLDWHLLAEPEHRGVQQLVRDLNRVYGAEPALWEADTEPRGFEWIDANNADQNVLAYLRSAPVHGGNLLCLANFSPVVREGYRVGVPCAGPYLELINTDSSAYGGSNVGNAGSVESQPTPWHGRSHSLELTLPPLACLWLRVPHAQTRN